MRTSVCEVGLLAYRHTVSLCFALARTPLARIYTYLTLVERICMQLTAETAEYPRVVTSPLCAASLEESSLVCSWICGFVESDVACR